MDIKFLANLAFLKHQVISSMVGTGSHQRPVDLLRKEHFYPHASVVGSGEFSVFVSSFYFVSLSPAQLFLLGTYRGYT